MSSRESESFHQAIAVNLVPILIVAAAYVSWILDLMRVGGGTQTYVNLWCFAAIPFLWLLLIGGYRFYAQHPSSGMLTAVALVALFPISQAARADDQIHWVFGIASGLAGAVAVLWFLALFLLDFSSDQDIN